MEKSKRKKLILICDDIRGHSGVANQGKEIIISTVGNYNWVHLAGAPKHPQAGQKFDISEHIQKDSKVEDADVKLVPVEGYGNAEIIRQVIETEQPDGLVIFTDPRRWLWLFDIEREIRSKIPIMYYNIWDNYPVPYYNKPYYESVDGLFAISRLTEEVNKKVLGDKAEEKVLTYVPHGINKNNFFKIGTDSPQYNDLEHFKKESLGTEGYDFILLYNSQNMRRKGVSDIMRGYDKFCERIGETKANRCLLILHTNPKHPAGTDLYAVRDDVCTTKGCNIKFSSNKVTTSQLNYMYNMVDGVIQASLNEGWGLSVTEAMMTGTPVIAGYTGGVKDQVTNEETGKIGEWGEIITPRANICVGSQTTPYIYEDVYAVGDIGEGIYNLYNLSKKEREEMGNKAMKYASTNFSTEQLKVNIVDSIDRTIKQFKPREVYDFKKI